MLAHPTVNQVGSVGVVTAMHQCFPVAFLLGHQMGTVTVVVCEMPTVVTTPESSRNFAEKTLIYGCKAAIEQHYHQNFRVNFEQVKCPASLVKVTGIRSKSENGLGHPQEMLKLFGQGQATTTMDCCKPTCAWRRNVGSFTDPNFPQVYVCSKEGSPLSM